MFCKREAYLIMNQKINNNLLKIMQLNQQKLRIQHKPVRKILSNDESNYSSIDTKSNII